MLFNKEVFPTIVQWCFNMYVELFLNARQTIMALISGFVHCKCVHESFLQVIEICTTQKKPSNVIVNIFMAMWIYMGWFGLRIEGPTLNIQSYFQNIEYDEWINLIIVTTLKFVNKHDVLNLNVSIDGLCFVFGHTM